ncbi:alpha/beta fold hydrolase [Streptomyces sp. TRM 70351]|uniref:alpha/beta fold hydrolase n=1 Tax=Streptomyces sp. TRM 70351 TaxID=3116552 RepID=UPI002E7ABA67|nr:alpha/beta fold hydrolase [Streptomyces sp. TRM 70351]MEE1927700.1 alpha/beta fold hydrolase [Streptomyces sp. TRM 70351]
MASTDPPDVRTDAPRRGPSADGARRGAPRTVPLPGLTLAVRSLPGGPGVPSSRGTPPALYVHGLGGSSLNWLALMAELGGDVDGEAVDLPGFGYSPPPQDGDYSVSGHARAVVRYLDAAGRGPVHLFGNSLGGAVATRVAAQRPDLVRSLTLVSPALPELRPQRTALPTALLALPGVVHGYRRLTRDWTAERRTRAVLSLCYGDPSKVPEEHLAEAVAEYERRLALPHFWDSLARSARGVVDAYTVGGQHGLWRQAQRVLAPTLLVYGGRDKLVSARMARKAGRAFRDSRVLTLPDAGHVAMMEYPREVAAAVRRLLAEADGAPPPPGARPAEPGSGS